MKKPPSLRWPRSPRRRACGCSGRSSAPASTLSFHLKELVHADLVSVEREGRNLHYRPALGRMNELLAYLTAHCCMGQPCAPGAAKRRSTC